MMIGTLLANLPGEVIRWFGEGSNWQGGAGIPARVLEHLEISILAVALATAVALPVGLAIGHTRRAAFLAISIGNVGRALPSFGVLGIVFPFTLRYAPGSIGFPPTLIALVLLGIPPILTNTYVGIQTVDDDTIEAARGMGLSGRQILFHLELPLSIALIVAGLRTAAVQVVATATLGALVSWGGLGRFIVDGFALNDHAMIVGGAILVAALAILTDLGLGFLERAVAPRTSSQRRRWRRPVRPGTDRAPG